MPIYLKAEKPTNYSVYRFSTPYFFVMSSLFCLIAISNEVHKNLSASITSV